MREQLLAAEHLAGVAQERLEQRELLRGQVDHLAARLGAPRAHVEVDAADVERHRLAAVAAAGAQPGADAREQLLEHERLGDVVVGAEVEPGDRVGDLVARGEHEHRQLLAAGAQRAQDREAVLARQADVEDQQVEVVVDAPSPRPARRPSQTVVV